MLLRELIKCDDLRNRLAVLVSKIKEEHLRFWQVHIPHYTDHGETHCDSVEKNLDQLIPERIKMNLDEYEVFILLCSVWLHDIGVMVREPSEPIEEVRATHHMRCIKIIMENFNELLPNDAERVAIGMISRAHREIDLSTLNEQISISHRDLGNQRVRIRFLAALLRLADGCDICAIRAKSDTTAWQEEARFHHLLHRRVSGIDFKPDVATIEINMLAQSEFDKTIMTEFITNKLRLELQFVQEALTQNGINYFLVKENFLEVQMPLPPIEVPPKILGELRARLGGEIISALGRKDPSFAFKTCKEFELFGEKVPLEIAIEISKAFEEKKDFQSAVDLLKFCLKSYPNNKHLFGYIGILEHEYLFNWKEGYEFFKKAFEADPKNPAATLNYAEACLVTGKPDDARNLAIQASEIALDLRHFINAKLIQTLSLYFLAGKEREGFEMIQTLILIIPKEFRKNNTTWEYLAIIKFLKESNLQPSIKSMLLDLIDTVSREGKKSIEEFKSTHLGHNTLPKF